MDADPSTNISVQVITTDAEFDALLADWDILHTLCIKAGLFNSGYWNRLWWQHYGQSASLYILVARLHGTVIGIAPLYQSTTRKLKLIKARTVQFIGSGGDTSPDDLCVLFHPDHESVATRAICDYLFEASDITRIRLSDLGQDSLLVSTLRKCAQARRWQRPLESTQQRLVDVLPETVEEFEGNLSRNARKQRKQRRTRLHKAGHAVFSFCRSACEIDEAFEALMRLHHERFSSKGGSDSFQSDNYRRFHRAVMEKAQELDELKLLTLRIDGTIVGVEYAFLCNGTLSFFQTGFDPRYQHLSLGHLLMMHTIDQAIVDGAIYIDLLKGDYPYKSTYARQTCHTVELDFWKSRPLLVLIRLARALSRH
ncbi:GNAT family N-acetyltransferase [Granulosicoccus sp. 3-233]|uniref:GNAT family N-acetyltransferase n=1 Tax=Granulosicoccus sp. 3-233 TaxID=3417969 RepID=UPI003D350CAE